MRFKVVVDETGKLSKATLNDMDISAGLAAFEIKSQIGGITTVELSLILVDVDLDLANIQLQGEDHDRANAAD